MNKIAVVGASGLVGEEFLKILADDHTTPCEVLKFRRSRNVPGNELSLSEDGDKLKECKFIFNAASSEAAEQIISRLGAGQYLIDNSSAFRMQKDVPLVVPEVNGNLVTKDSHIIANPNCTAGILCVALKPLESFGIKQLIISTYQAASGAGKEGLAELRQQIEQKVQDNLVAPVFGFRLAGNVMSHNSPVRIAKGEAQGFNEEEFKVVEETRKILNRPDLPVSVTCMRVPVERAHTESVVVDLKNPVEPEELIELYRHQPGLKLVHQPEKNHFPMPLEAEGQRDVLVGRFRKDIFVPNRILFILAGDQLLKGAAWNAFQIFQLLSRKLTG